MPPVPKPFVRVNIMAKRLLLFDVDGTLTRPRQVIESDTWSFLQAARARDGVAVGLVGGSDLKKIVEQMGGDFERSTSSRDERSALRLIACSCAQLPTIWIMSSRRTA